MPPPPLPPDPRDESHLEALKICYYISAVLGVLGILFLAGHFTIFNTILGSEDFVESSKPRDAAAMETMMGVMVWFYLGIGLLVVALIVLDILCARALAARRNPVLIQVVAGINCLSMPLGTILGIFTFIVLARPSVRRLFVSS
ncbi:MAG: hypothetical protein ACON5H_08945 [Akkermansiaceae bacterium]